MDRSAFEGKAIPNLEYPFDPITPERMAVGQRTRWHQGPLAAALDWQAGTWFPRIAYLGLAPSTDWNGGRVREAELGWEAEDLAHVPSVLGAGRGAARQDYTQAAASGMSVGDGMLGDDVEVVNMHPDHPRRTIRFPADQPRVRLELRPRRMEDLPVRLSTVVLRPDRDEIVLTWCASTPIERQVSWSTAEAMRRDVQWIGRR
jgi:hypothetical protein